MRAFPLIVVLFVAGCAGNATVSATKSGGGVAPATPEEKLVAAYILEKANDPGSVEFAKWGPHLADHGPIKSMHVFYRSKNEMGAMVFIHEEFLVENQKVIGRNKRN